MQEEPANVSPVSECTGKEKLVINQGKLLVQKADN
jgi:hypothetical protein